MNIYQIGAYTLEESEEVYTILLNEKEYDEIKIDEMIKECIKELPQSFFGSRVDLIADIMCEKYNFIKTKTTKINLWDDKFN